MKQELLELYWNTIPVGIDNALDYGTLCLMWSVKNRTARCILHDLSSYDNGDNYILIRSGKTKGFYKTDDADEIAAYRKECLNKGRSIFAPVKKCNRILRADGEQYQIFNNLRVTRESKNMKQKDVCRRMRQAGIMIDESLLSKMENGVCLPTPAQLSTMARIYCVESTELIKTDLY